MADLAPPPAPGNLTVPLLFGWQAILLLVGFAVVFGVLYVLHNLSKADEAGRSEWQAYLDARSPRRAGPPEPSEDGPSGRTSGQGDPPAHAGASVR